jgi:hypothetical protein
VKDHWCDIFVLSVYPPTEDKSDDTKDNFYEELQRLLDQFLKNYMKMLLGYFNAEEGGKDILKQTLGNESLHEIVMIIRLE